MVTLSAQMVIVLSAFIVYWAFLLGWFLFAYKVMRKNSNVYFYGSSSPYLFQLEFLFFAIVGMQILAHHVFPDL